MSPEGTTAQPASSPQGDPLASPATEVTGQGSAAAAPASRDLLGGPPPTLLPGHPEADQALASGAAPAEVAARFPDASGPWAALAEQAAADERWVESYAYARTGYHRGLDALRRAGWKGHGPVPWSHEPNRGFLRALGALARAADAIGEEPEAQRCRSFLADCDPQAVEQLTGADWR